MVSVEEQIRSLLTRWERAFQARDVDAVLSVYAPGGAVVAFEIVPPLATVSRDSYRQNYDAFFAMFTGPLEVEFREMRYGRGGRRFPPLSRAQERPSRRWGTLRRLA
jgi:ketosteroid isomerase-like protein